jgi:hypothetical protein
MNLICTDGMTQQKAFRDVKGVVGKNKISYNGKRLCDGGEIEAEKLNLKIMFNQGKNVEFSSKAPLLQNRCYVPYFIKL